MSREQLVAMARRGLEHWRAGTGDVVDEVFRVPVSAYIDPERWQREVDRIFKRLPLVLGFSSELRNPGSYHATEVLGVPVLMVRGNDGMVRAFVNMCSHRGAQLVDPGTGSQRRFACPYHNWTYDTQGDLVGVFEADAFGPVDRSCLGLTPLPVAERAGLVFVVLTPGAAIDIDTFLCGYDELLEHLGFDEGFVVGRQTLAGPNWKLAYDGYLDFYHLPILHKNSFGPDMSPKALYHPFGPHQRVTSPDRAFASLAGVPEDEWDVKRLNGGVWTIFPHVSIAAFDAGGKVYMVSQLFPGDSVGESYTIQTFVHTCPPDDEQAELVAQRMAFLKHVVGNEDYKTGLSIQRAAETGAKQEFLFGRNEGGGHRFHRWVAAVLAADDHELDELFTRGVDVPQA